MGIAHIKPSVHTVPELAAIYEMVLFSFEIPNF